MGILEKVRRAIGRVGRPERRVEGEGRGGKGFACAACHATFDVQHKQCPECGSRLVVSTDDAGGESNQRVPW